MARTGNQTEKGGDDSRIIIKLKKNKAMFDELKKYKRSGHFFLKTKTIISLVDRKKNLKDWALRLNADCRMFSYYNISN